MKIACIGYREWALRIYDELARQTDHEFLIIRGKEEYDEHALVNFHPDMALFYGWSWIVSKEVVCSFDCVMLHPSPLPRYRGGSPIQNQIVRGEERSAVTFFLMTEELDAGDIIAQEEFSLEGHLEEILDRISEIGLRLTLDILKHGYIRTPQNHSKATYCKRRTPAQSELTGEELRTASARVLYDKIRILEDPYPNAFIPTADGGKLYIKRAEFEPPNSP